MAYLDKTGLAYFWSKIKALLANKVDKVSGKGLSTNDFTAAYKTKLDGIATGANAYSLPTASSSTLGGVKVGSNLSISSGVLSAKDTTYSAATTSANGLMSSADKSKLDGIAAGANKYSLPTANNTTLGGVKLSSTIYGTSGPDDGVAATPAAVSAVRELANDAQTAANSKRDAGANGSVSANGSLTINVSNMGRRLLAAGDALYVLNGWAGSAYLVTIMENSVVKATAGGASAATVTIKNTATYSIGYLII